MLPQIQQRKTQISLTTSIIVPCFHGHFEWIPQLLDNYRNQTVLPDEVVISLSEYQKVSHKELKEVQQCDYPFQVSILKYQDKQLAGCNRNCACNAAKGEILICQDADDIPHPQRVEIIKYLFETYEIDHLLHSYLFHHDSVGDLNSFTRYEKFTFDHFLQQFTTYNKLWCIGGPEKNVPIHFGNVAITKNLFKKISWDEEMWPGEDADFCERVYSNEDLEKAVFLEPLLSYRQHFSASLYQDKQKKTRFGKLLRFLSHISKIRIRR